MFGLQPHAVLCGCAAPAFPQLRAAQPGQLFLPEDSHRIIEYRPAFGQEFPHSRGWCQAWGDTWGLRLVQDRGRRALHQTTSSLGPWPQVRGPGQPACRVVVPLGQLCAATGHPWSAGPGVTSSDHSLASPAHACPSGRPGTAGSGPCPCMAPLPCPLHLPQAVNSLELWLVPDVQNAPVGIASSPCTPAAAPCGRQ